MSTTEDLLKDVSDDVLDCVMGEKPLVIFFLICRNVSAVWPLSQAICEARQSDCVQNL